MKLPKKLLLIGVSAVLLIGCSSDASEEVIEEPTDGTSQIESNESLMNRYDDMLDEEQANYDDADNDTVRELHMDQIKRLEILINNLEYENELLEETLIYNDEFITVQGMAVYVKQSESMLNEETLVSNFNDDILNTLEKYNEIISNGAILINALPLGESDDKYAVISAYYSQEAIDNLNFDSDEKDYAFNNADYLNVHAQLEEFISSHGDFDIVPELFTFYTGKSY